jgi:hypothetical protein
MFRKLVKTTEIDIEGQRYVTHFFEQRTARGTCRYSCEVLLGAADRIILDDDSMIGLEARMARLVPATVYSRLLAGRPEEAA